MIITARYTLVHTEQKTNIWYQGYTYEAILECYNHNFKYN